MVTDNQEPYLASNELSSERYNVEYVKVPSEIGQDRAKAIADDMLQVIAGEIPTTQQDILDQFKTNNNEFLLASDQTGKIIGYATLFPRSDKPQACYLNKVATNPGWRQKGVATQLIKEAQELYQEIFLVNIVRDERTREAMIKLYLKLGFESQASTVFTWVRS